MHHLSSLMSSTPWKQIKDCRERSRVLAAVLVVCGVSERSSARIQHVSTRRQIPSDLLLCVTLQSHLLQLCLWTSVSEEVCGNEEPSFPQPNCGSVHCSEDGVSPTGFSSLSLQLVFGSVFNSNFRHLLKTQQACHVTLMWRIREGEMWKDTFKTEIRSRLKCRITLWHAVGRCPPLLSAAEIRSTFWSPVPQGWYAPEHSYW